MRKLKHDEIPRPDADQMDALPRHPVSVILEDIRSIHNVGAIFRTSDAARIEHLYLTGITGTPDHRKLRKSSLGAERTVPWSHHGDTEALIHKLKDEGHTIAALEQTSDPTPISKVTLEHFPLTFVVGNEVHGVSEELLPLVDVAFEIPQFGAKQSLNVSVAYGIAVFDIVRHLRSISDKNFEPVEINPASPNL